MLICLFYFVKYLQYQFMALNIYNFLFLGLGHLHQDVGKDYSAELGTFGSSKKKKKRRHRYLSYNNFMIYCYITSNSLR